MFFFQKWNCFGIVPFQDNMQFNYHSFDSISCQFVIPPQFTLKVENSRIIPIQTFQFQCPDTGTHNMIMEIKLYIIIITKPAKEYIGIAYIEKGRVEWETTSINISLFHFTKCTHNKYIQVFTLYRI